MRYLIPLIRISHITFILWIIHINVFSQHNEFTRLHSEHKIDPLRGLSILGNMTKLTLDSLVAVDSLIIDEEKFRYEYDSKGNLLFESLQRWDYIKWNNFMNWTYVHDNEGKVILKKRKRWKDDKWVKDDSIIFTYDSMSNLLSRLEYDWNDDQWVRLSKRTYAYNENNDLTSSLVERWTNEKWVSKIQDTYTYDFDGNLVIYLSEALVPNDWWDKERYSYSYDSEGNRVSAFYEATDPYTLEWENSTLYTYSYDSTGNLTSYIYHSWNGESWINETRYRYLYGIDQRLVQAFVDTIREEEWAILGRVSYTYDSNGNMTHAIAEAWYEENWISWNSRLEFSDSFGRDYRYHGHELIVFYSTITKVELESPLGYVNSLEQNYPNPFNPVTKIKFSIPSNEFVSLKIYDVLGREVKTLVEEFKLKGSYEVSMDASSLNSGVYFYTFQVGEFIDTKKMVLLK